MTGRRSTVLRLATVWRAIGRTSRRASSRLPPPCCTARRTKSVSVMCSTVAKMRSVIEKVATAKLCPERKVTAVLSDSLESAGRFA